MVTLMGFGEFMSSPEICQRASLEALGDCKASFVCIPTQFVTDLATVQTPLEVIKTVAHWFYKIFEADRASITLFNGNGMLRIIAIEGIDIIQLGDELPIAGTMIGRVFTTGKTEYCRDLTKSEDEDCKLLLSGNIHSCIDVPLIKNESCFGTINVGRLKVDGFSDSDIIRLESVAYLISTLLYIDNLTEKLRIIADTDSLTGVLNRRAFLRQFAKTSAEQRRSRGVGIALFDLDHFKKVNDSYGHNAGDQVLVHFCEMLRKICRAGDFISRFGGEEFCILTSDIAFDDFKELLNRIVDAIRDTPVNFGQDRIPITVSIGAVHMNYLSNEFDKIYSQVDKALYRAKNEGRNRVALEHMEN